MQVSETPPVSLHQLILSVQICDCFFSGTAHRRNIVSKHLAITCLAAMVPDVPVTFSTYNAAPQFLGYRISKYPTVQIRVSARSKGNNHLNSLVPGHAGFRLCSRLPAGLQLQRNCRMTTTVPQFLFSSGITFTVSALVGLYASNHGHNLISLGAQFPRCHHTCSASLTVENQGLIAKETSSFFQLFIRNTDGSLQMKPSEFLWFSQINDHITVPKQIGIYFPRGDCFKFHIFTFYSIVI